VKGGFAIGGFDATKTDPQDYFRVTPDSVRVYIDKTPNIPKGTTKGGFAIGGFDQSKGGGGGIQLQDLLTVGYDSIRMYINDNPAKGTTKGGFAIGGFDQAKSTPGAKFLNVATDFSGIINPAQNRILWYPLKNAFLTGKVLVEKPDSVGVNSFASGYESKAIGNYSQALGYGSIANGDFSTAIGYSNRSSGAYSFTLGYANIASGVNSNAFGIASVATGLNSFAMGYNARALGQYAYVMGFNSAALGGPSFAMGDRCQAMKWGSFSMGWLTRSDAEHSMVIGDHNISKAQNLFVIGRANDTTVYHTDSWNGFYDDDPAFIIGNGWVYNAVAMTRSNAFIVLKGGKTGINMNYPTYMLDVNGEMASRTDNALRFRNSSYSTFFHQDASDLYLLVTNSGDPDGSWNSYRPFRINYSTGNVYLGSSNSGSNYTLTVLSSGKTGMGTINPLSNLEVNVSGSNGYAGIGINKSGGRYITLNQGVSGVLNFTEPGVSDLVAFDFNTSRVGILRNPSANALEVAGNASKDVAGDWLANSDSRIKTEITEISDAEETLLKLHPIKFRYSDTWREMHPSITDKVYYNFIAQEFSEVFPESVMNSGEYLGNDPHPVLQMDSYNAQIVAIKAVQDLIVENRQLKSELQSLRERLDMIELTMKSNTGK
jgi:hypothetical protein